MSHTWQVADASEEEVVRLAERLALKLAAGDVVALAGPLGAGKTTFARALIRAMLGDASAEVPSPTFSLMQTYATPRLELAHLDLYRLAGGHELAELGLDEHLASGAALVEWPERAPDLRAENRLDVHLAPAADPERRTITLRGTGSWGSRLARVEAIAGFLESAPLWRTASVAYLQGDASARAYARLKLTRGENRVAVLMDQPRQPDGPPIRGGLPYSRIAHLAEDIRPFVAVGKALGEAGLSAPEIYAWDLDQGFILLEDLGDRVFGQEMNGGTPQAALWRVATEALLVLSTLPVPEPIALPGGVTYSVPDLDLGVLEVEAGLLPDWYWPAVKGEAISAGARSEFNDLWSPVFARLDAEPRGWLLRDYHSPNLIWLPEREGPRRAGIIDFQDALRGPAAYDLVSLLEDARVDVPPELEDDLLVYYGRMRRVADPRFDPEAFGFAYAALGVQRNTKILGIFARLAKRDGKRAYLRHIPRIWRYLARGLAHPGLAELRRWYDGHFPAEIRSQPLDI
jgi:hypothetical protein